MGTFAAILSRSVRSGAPPGFCASGWAAKIYLIYETSISTVENPPEAAAWVFESQFQQEWQGHIGQSSSRRPQAPAPLIRDSAAGAQKHRLSRSGARCA